MFAWETAPTTRDTDQIVRPVELGFEWLEAFSGPATEADPLQRMILRRDWLFANKEEACGV